MHHDRERERAFAYVRAPNRACLRAHSAEETLQPFTSMIGYSGEDLTLSVVEKGFFSVLATFRRNKRYEITEMVVVLLLFL